MSTTPQENFTGLLCLKMLLSQTRRNVNFMALVSEEVQKEFLKDNNAVITKIADEQQLRPEPIEDINNLSNYNGPILSCLNNGFWILIVNSAQLFSGDKISIFDPNIQSENKQILVPKEQLLSRVTANNIVFRNLTQVDSSKQTKLFAFSAIAGHHNSPVDLREIMHEYAVGEEEVSDLLFKQIVNDRNFKMKKIKQPWANLKKSETVFPCIVEKKNGKYAIICGFRQKDDVDEVVVVDPEVQAQGNNNGKFLFLAQEDFEQTYTNKIILLKKIYKLSDENQPFSLRWFIPEFIKNKGIFGEIILMVVLLTIFSLVVPLFFQIVVDKVLVNAAYNTLNVLGIGIIAVILFNTLTSYIRSYLLLFATNKIDISTATKTFTHLMRLPVDFFDRVPSGVLLKHMQQTEKIRGFLSGNLFFTLLDIFALCIFIPFLMFYSITLTCIVLGFSALMALVIACLIKPFQRRLDELYQAEGKRQSMLVEAIHGIKTVKSLALEPVERKIWDDSTAYAIKSYFRVGKISMTAQSISQMLEMLMTICVIWIGAHLVFDHVISIGALIAFQMLANRVTGPLVKIVGLIHEYQQIALSVRMLGVVMNTPAEPSGGGVRNALKGGIEFENITFQYRQDLPQVIKNFSLKINPGETIGFVGRSGSGKTTLTKLLQGLYPVSQGLLKIDGIDIREIDKAHLRRNIGVVLQENYFFSGTVRANISLPKQNASLEEIIYVAKLAGADEFIQKLPRGYDTVLEENAANLSGGQKQRLAIARALLTNPPILIFDEATSALDPESENVIRKNLKAIARGRTVLIVSHRLSIINHADKIIVIDSGVQSECGTHNELLANKGIYSEFWNQQMNHED